MPIEPAPPHANPLQLNYSEAFLKQLKRLTKKYRRIRQDLESLIKQLSAGETPGDQIQATRYTAYKVRVANRDAGRGKIGGYRVIYYVQTAQGRLLVAIYSKTEQSDIPADEIARILKDELGG